MYVVTNVRCLSRKRMPDKMTETEFQELICDLWVNEKMLEAYDGPDKYGEHINDRK